MDRFSRFPEVFGIPNKKAQTIAKVFVEQIVCRYGCPRTLLSDRGREFLNELADETYKLLNCYEAENLSSAIYVGGDQ